MHNDILITLTSKFRDLRLSNGYYVDKTDFLRKFLRNASEATLFTRPRRFGKTLTMSMMAEFFDIRKNSKDLFAGLKISENETLCKEWMNQYPVVFMSLKDIGGSSFPKAFSKFQDEIKNTCARYAELRTSSKVYKEDRDCLIAIKNEKANESKLQGALATLTRALKAYYGKSAIVLIDEYDMPLAKAQENGYYNEMIEFIRGFLSAALKDNPYAKFAVLTGCLCIAKESIFTGLNNIICYDISNTTYASMFGFTNEEVDTLLAQAGFSDKKALIKEWYDGYRFGENQEIYCPFSIMNYVNALLSNKDRAPETYWKNVSGNELTKGFVRKLQAGEIVPLKEGETIGSETLFKSTPKQVRNAIYELLSGKSLAVQLDMQLNYPTVYDKPDSFWTLLYMGGYLTKTSERTNCIDIPNQDDAMLTIPNKEVRQVFGQEVLSWFNDLVLPNNREFINAFWRRESQVIEEILCDALLRSQSYFDSSEQFYHGLMLGFFLMTNPYSTLSNRESGLGRYDLVVWNKHISCAAVIEIKCAKTETDQERLLDEGLKQIEEQKYDSHLRHENYATIAHWCMSFYQKNCKVKVRLV